MMKPKLSLSKLDATTAGALAVRYGAAALADTTRQDDRDARARLAGSGRSVALTICGTIFGSPAERQAVALFYVAGRGWTGLRCRFRHPADFGAARARLVAVVNSWLDRCRAPGSHVEAIATPPDLAPGRN